MSQVSNPVRWDLCMETMSDLGVTGILAVEMFVVGGRLLLNEIAPRPHNSGHYSIDACDVSQFELQVRTLAGLPLAVGGGAVVVLLEA